MLAYNIDNKEISFRKEAGSWLIGTRIHTILSDYVINAWCSYRRQAEAVMRALLHGADQFGREKAAPLMAIHEGGNIMLVGGIILGVACAMYAGAVMDMEDIEVQQEKLDK